MPDASSLSSGPARPVGAYQEHAPPASLAPYIECFWSRTDSEESRDVPRAHRVMPDGCADILVTFGGDGTLLGATAVGPMTRPIVFHASSATRYLGVRFRPGVAGVVFGLPAAELTDQRPSLDNLWEHADGLTESLALAKNAESAIKTLSAAVARRLLASDGPTPGTVVAATARIAATRGTLSIGALASELGVTRQHLARSFALHVGVSPKMLARILRVRSVVSYARGVDDVDWSRLALDTGYYDQSHLIAEVKELTGLGPTGWLANRG